MVKVWQQEKLAPATVQTDLSFLRGLARWLGEPGFIRKPAHYGLTPAEYRRHGNAMSDKSWTAAGIDIAAVIEQAKGFDRHVGASLGLIRAFGLRRKESVMFRPYEHVVPFEHTGLPLESRKADEYVWIKGKGGCVRWVPLERDGQRSAVALARSLVTGRDAHMGDPAKLIPGES